MFSFMTLLDLCMAAVALSIIKRLLTKKPSHPLPPGPKPLPLLGNLLDLPSEQEWKTFAKWGQKYGEIVSINIFGQIMIILNTPELTADLLDKKSSIYSDRPVLQMGGELVGWKDALVLLPYGERLRTYRRNVHRVIGTPQNIKPFLPNIEKQTHKLLRKLLAKPLEFSTHVRDHSGSIILKMAYGWDVQESNDPFVRSADQAVNNFSVTTAPGAFLVDIIPALKHVPEWFPGAGFKKTAKVFRQETLEMIDQPFNWVKQQMAAGTAEKSFTSSLLEGCESDEAEFLVKWSAGSLYGGGADTTVAQINSLFLALAMFPEVQKTAQEEIDRVVGKDRLPTYSDRPNLPYLEAVINECFRWHQVAPTGVPHRVSEDDVHNGYLIPKGALVITNVWAMGRDARVYPDPEKFDPTRHIASPGKPAQANVKNWCFGFGRRICPGLVLGDTSVFIAAATILATFNVSRVVENGVPDHLFPDQTTGTISHQKPFRCNINPRSEKAVELIQQTEPF